jgi:hypothetical protein
MDPTRFDSVAKIFANRRLSRRQAVQMSGAGLAAAGLATVGLAAVHAQDATPTATDATPAATDASGYSPYDANGKKIQYLFVQSFQKGNIEPKFGIDGTWTLTLEQGLGQTIYFSNRPARVVGASPTPDFLNGLGFPDDNPPNAVLVFQNEAGNEDITALELFNPRYEMETNTATYDVQWLKEYEQMDLTLQETPQPPSEASAEFGAAHLFIDDCADGTMRCYRYDQLVGGDNPTVGTIDNSEHDGYCYSWAGMGCLPCKPWINRLFPARDHWNAVCNERFAPACEGKCAAGRVCNSQLCI